MRRFSVNIVFYTLAFLATSAHASEGGTSIGILGLSDAQLKQQLVCQGESELDSSPSPSRSVAACSALLEDSFFKSGGASRSVIYLYRSQANLKLGKFAEAIADADEAALDLPDFDANEHQRCWARAYAGTDLDIAMKACLRSIELGGAKPYRLDSLALLHLRRGQWMPAVTEYDSAAQWIKDSIYGRILAEYGFVASLHGNPEAQAVFRKERIAPLEAKLSPEEMETARRKFAAMGVTLESVEALGKSQ